MANPFLRLVKTCDPAPGKAGNILLIINAMGMVFAALSNTYAAAVDKNTSAEDKKFLVPAGFATGVANIGLYYAITTQLIKGLKKSAETTIKNLAQNNPTKYIENVTKLVDKKIAKEKSQDIATSMKNLFKNEDGTLSQAAKDFYKNTNVDAAGILGAFVGAVVGSAILTPIIRDVSAYFVQKHMEKNSPELKEKPYKPYFEPTRIESVRYGSRKQPLSMKNYMAFTNSGNLKV